MNNIKFFRLGILASSLLLSACLPTSNSDESDDNNKPTIDTNPSVVSKTAPLPASDTDCTNGGIFIETGIDENGNGLLDVNEVDDIAKVCHGDPGSQGPAGVAGSSGPTGAPGDPGKTGLSALLRVSDEIAGRNCENGGLRIDTGLDKDRNNILDEIEVNPSLTSYICHGNDNEAGGTITAVAAGNGLTGGGVKGDVSLALQVPLNLSGRPITIGRTPAPVLSVTHETGGLAGKFNGDVTISGDITIDGVIHGNVEIDQIDVTQITGLLGQGYTMHFPDVLNNLATLEVEGVVLTEDVVIIHGPGVDIEVIPGFFPDGTGRPWDLPGVGAEHPFIIETDDEDNVANLTTFFDAYTVGSATIKSMSLIVDYGHGAEFSRINFFEYTPDFYEAGVDGRTRFHWRQSEIPNNILRWELGGTDMFLDSGSFNPTTDKMVEIAGVSGANFFPEVVDNPENRTLTFTFPHQEGMGIMDWVTATVLTADQNGLKSISVIDWNGSAETGRTNYFETFPMKFEMSGYGLNTKLVGKVVVKYNWSEPG